MASHLSSRTSQLQRASEELASCYSDAAFSAKVCKFTSKLSMCCVAVGPSANSVLKPSTSRVRVRQAWVQGVL
jgi:hypothetical protein